MHNFRPLILLQRKVGQLRSVSLPACLSFPRKSSPARLASLLSKWNIGTHGAFAPRASNKKVVSRRDVAGLETIQSPGQQVLVPPHSKASLFSVVCCLVVCAIHGRAKIYLKRLSQRDLPAITSFSSATAGLGLARRGRTKNFRRFPPSFRTNETSHLVFPTEEKVSFLILLLLFSRSPSLSY